MKAKSTVLPTMQKHYSSMTEGLCLYSEDLSLAIYVCPCFALRRVFEMRRRRVRSVRRKEGEGGEVGRGVIGWRRVLGWHDFISVNRMSL